MDRYDITIQMLGVEASGPQYVWEKVPAEEGELVLYTDAQATIAALQARVQELEQWVQDQSTANLETMRHTDEMQSRAMEAEQQLTQRTAELEAANKLLYKKNCELGRFETMISDLQAGVDRLVHMAEMKQAALTATSQPHTQHDIAQAEANGFL